MKLLPAVDVKGGKCVQLVGGKPGTEKVTIDDVIVVARRWQSDGAEMIHIIDLDSALGTGDNETLIEMLVGDMSVPVQVGGGVRTAEKAQRLFEIGCERVIVGTRAIQDRPFIESLADEFGDGIVVAVDASADEVLIKGWQEGSGRDAVAVAKDLGQLPIWGFLYTNVEVEGRLQGIDPGRIRSLVSSTTKPVIVSGGITTVADLEQLRRMDVHSVVVGMAIYTGRIDFKAAMRDFR
jgi:phosphoribosylformimino-5-aminoimidazole carboxamide ribotide isomerase